MPRVIHFEIPADDPERAADFYRKVFGWKIEKWEGPAPYWLVSTGEKAQRGIDGGITSRSNLRSVTNTIDVPSVDDFVKRVLEAGGRVVAPKMPVPGVGYLAYCTDSEGNVFGIIQPEMSAR